jgi:hypothetical protein
MKKRLVNLINPQQCVGCRFCQPTTVSLDDTEIEEIVICTRKDCDNWDNKSSIEVEFENLGL